MNIKINNNAYWANPGETILQVAQREGIKIPTLCYMSELSPTAPAESVWWRSADSWFLPCAFPWFMRG
ncbi:MAG: 2Fe-2S iron-sulfur cluster-binding protein [Candidatus Marinimicrobia bacterium]|nr:2Fe-2S iron-sulfur cluster-binding protein [Candidatus Neomarinimicrobiota bacterium]